MMRWVIVPMFPCPPIASPYTNAIELALFVFLFLFNYLSAFLSCTIKYVTASQFSPLPLACLELGYIYVFYVCLSLDCFLGLRH